MDEPQQMTKEKIQGLKIGVYGTQGSGKTEFAKHILRTRFKAPLVFTPHKKDFENEMIYLHVTNYNTDIDTMIKKAIKAAKNYQIDCIVIDEADGFFKNNHNVKEGATDLFNNHRHYPEGKGVTVMLISRRPQDIPTVFVETSQFTAVFKLEGDNVKKKFNGIRAGFGDLIIQDNFKYKSYEYYLKEIGEAPVLCQAIPFKKSKIKQAKDL